MHEGTSKQRFAARLSELVSECHSSRKALARSLGRSEASFANWLKGTTLPNSREIVNRLERLLGEEGASLRPGELVELWVAADEERRGTEGDGQQEDSDVKAGPGTRLLPLPPGRRLLSAAFVLLIAASVVSLWLTTRHRPREAERAIVSPIYRVDADRTTGAHVHELPPGSRVDQWFTATQHGVIRLAAMIGRDPQTAPPPVPDGGPVGRVRFQLLDDRDRVLADRTVQARNNVETVVTLEQPVPLEVGKRYILRVTNRADVILGFYFNRNPYPRDGTILYGAVDPPGVSSHEHALSGNVLGSPLRP
jgi:hypothetical protein